MLCNSKTTSIQILYRPTQLCRDVTGFVTTETARNKSHFSLPVFPRKRSRSGFASQNFTTSKKSFLNKGLTINKEKIKA